MKSAEVFYWDRNILVEKILKFCYYVKDMKSLSLHGWIIADCVGWRHRFVVIEVSSKMAKLSLNKNMLKKGMRLLLFLLLLLLLLFLLLRLLLLLFFLKGFFPHRMTVVFPHRMTVLLTVFRGRGCDIRDLSSWSSSIPLHPTWSALDPPGFTVAHTCKQLQFPGQHACTDRGRAGKRGAWSGGGETGERGPREGSGAEGFIMQIAQTPSGLRNNAIFWDFCAWLQNFAWGRC